jgi:hypothetical protein
MALRSAPVTVFVFPAQQVFQQHFQRHRQLVQVAQAFGGIRQAEIVVGLVVDLQGFKGFRLSRALHHSFESARLRTEGTGRAINLALFSVAG